MSYQKARWIIKLFLLILLIDSHGIAQDDWFVSPGVKLGYVFGQGGGFIMGAEVSVTRIPEFGGPIWGAFVSIEKTKKATIAHIGIEASGLIGLSLGPSFIASEEGRSWGVGATMFGGVIVMPYLRLTYLNPQLTIPEWGSFVKLPFSLNGRKFNVAG